MTIEDNLAAADRFNFNDIPYGTVPNRIKDIRSASPRPCPIVDASAGHFLDIQNLAQDGPETGSVVGRSRRRRASDPDVVNAQVFIHGAIVSEIACDVDHHRRTRGAIGNGRLALGTGRLAEYSFGMDEVLADVNRDIARRGRRYRA